MESLRITITNFFQKPWTATAGGGLSKRSTTHVANKVAQETILSKNGLDFSNFTTGVIKIRPFRFNNSEECKTVSRMIYKNYIERKEYQRYPKEIMQVYLDANTPAGIQDTMSKPNTIGYVATVAEKIIGIVIGRYNIATDGSFSDLQIRRLHTAIDADVQGTGKALLAICAMEATARKVHRLSTTATWPAKDFFVHMGWQGVRKEHPYKSRTLNRDIVVPQFCATFDIRKKT